MKVEIPQELLNRLRIGDKPSNRIVDSAALLKAGKLAGIVPTSAANWGHLREHADVYRSQTIYWLDAHYPDWRGWRVEYPQKRTWKITRAAVVVGGVAA